MNMIHYQSSLGRGGSATSRRRRRRAAAGAPRWAEQDTRAEPGPFCGQGVGRRLRCGEAELAAARAWGGGAGRRTELLRGRGEAEGVRGGGAGCGAGVRLRCGEAGGAAARQ